MQLGKAEATAEARGSEGELWPAYVPPPRYADPNPMVRKLGYGPEGATCRDCDWLLRLQHHDRTYRKCEVRGVTHGAGTDHKVSFRACASFAFRSSGEVRLCGGAR